MSDKLRYAETGEVHLDFHGATNTTIDFIISRYGMAAMDEIFRKVGRDVYQSIRADLVAGDAGQLVRHWRHFFTRENCDYAMWRSSSAPRPRTSATRLPAPTKRWPKARPTPSIPKSPAPARAVR